MSTSARERERPAYRRLLQLVRHNSRSVLTTRNRVDVLQDAATFSPRLMHDLEHARHSIHLQDVIRAADDFTERIAAIPIERARAGAEVRLLYDPVGSRATLTRACLDTNIDIRGFSINYEINAVLLSERLARQLEDDFACALAHCRPFDLAADERRGRAARFRDSVARLLSPLL